MKNGDVITSLNILFGKKKFNLEIAIRNLHILMDSDQKQLDLCLVLPRYPNYGQKIYVTEGLSDIKFN